MILTAIVIAQSAPVRTVVYSYNVGVINNPMNVSVSKEDTPSGTSYQGKITVAIEGIEPDGGLITKVSETGHDSGTTAPATCVAYPNTGVICDATSPTPEQMAVLRTLNPKFLDPTALDAKGHWHIAPGDSMTIDYTMGKADPSGNVPITGVRDETAPRSIHTQMTYDYNTAKSIATQVKELQTINEARGASNSIVTVDITANLQSDSLAAK